MSRSYSSRRTTRRHGAPLMLLLALALSWAGSADAELYRWVDEHGRVHYGDRVPPRAAAQGRDVMDSSGRVTKTVRGAVSEEEREALRKRLEQEKIERIKQEEKERKDRILLMTFTSERDLRIVHEERIRIYDTTIRLLERKVKKQADKLLDLEKGVSRYEKNGAEVPDQLVKDLGVLSRQLQETRTYLDQKQVERQEVVDRFEADLARYRELKSRERTLGAEAEDTR
jgi:hypothetical protein